MVVFPYRALLASNPMPFWRTETPSHRGFLFFGKSGRQNRLKTQSGFTFCLPSLLPLRPECRFFRARRGISRAYAKINYVLLI